MFSTVAFTMFTLEKAHKFNYVSCQSVGSFTALSMVVFALLGIFFADKWWYGIVGLLLSVAVGTLLCDIFNRSKNAIYMLGAFGIFLCPVLALLTYIFLY